MWQCIMCCSLQDRVAQDDLKVLFGEKVAADDIFEKLENKKGDGVRSGLGVYS